MSGPGRVAALLGVAGILIASVAGAGVPSPGNSSVPPCFSLVQSNSGTPDPHGTFSVVVRDVANNPMANASVVIDLSNCHDLYLCQDQLDPNAVVNCPAKTTRKFTDITGTVQFDVLGGSNGLGNATTLQGGGRIYANGTLIGSPTVSAFDLDGASGVGINDLSVWLTDFGVAGNPPYGRSDYDCSGTVGINDLSLWLTEFGFGTSVSECIGIFFIFGGFCGP